MIQTYQTLEKMLGEKFAKEIIEILVNHFNWYITFEEVQQLHLKFN